uniref:Kazal-like domain-containing protein n=1 Tax=Oryza brachyantha TaxID=4533 RepID=J3ND89_ORYBR
VSPRAAIPVLIAAAACAVLVLSSSSITPVAAAMFCGDCDIICGASCGGDGVRAECAGKCDGQSPAEACENCLRVAKRKCLTSCGDYCATHCT